MAVAVVCAGAAAVKVQVPRAGAAVLLTGPVAARAATATQRTAAVVPGAGGRQHQVITEKSSTAVVGSAL